MRPGRLWVALRALSLGIGSVEWAFAQSTLAAPLNWSADDSARIAFLQANGMREERTHAVVWAPRDSMAESWLVALADTLDQGVRELRALIGRRPWQRIGDAPVTFYLSPGRFVAHGSGYGAVFIPVSRVRERLAPFLHEAAHELLAPHPPFYGPEYPDTTGGRRAREDMPLWVFEGLPDYLAQTVAARTGVHEGDVFAIGGLDKADSVCAARVHSSPRGREILDAVGRPGRPAALFTTERAQVAPVFYACSQAFTREVVERIGLPVAIGVMPAIQAGRWREQLEASTGQPLDSIREIWLERAGMTVTPLTKRAP